MSIVLCSDLFPKRQQISAQPDFCVGGSTTSTGTDGTRDSLYNVRSYIPLLEPCKSSSSNQPNFVHVCVCLCSFLSLSLSLSLFQFIDFRLQRALFSLLLFLSLFSYNPLTHSPQHLIIIR